MSAPAEVPPAIRRALAVEPDGAGGDLVVEVVTVSEDGWPQSAMISWGELAVLAPDRLRMALWAGSRTTRRLSATGRATLLAVAEGAHHALRVEAAPLGESRVGDGDPRAIFDLMLVGAVSTAAPYAELLSGASFRLYDAGSVLARWRQMRRYLEDGGAGG